MAVPDLAALGRKDLELGPEQQAVIEKEAGLRCGVCLRRFVRGVEVTAIKSQFHPEHGMLGGIGTAYCCDREECKEQVLEAEDPVAVRVIEQVFLKPDPLPDPLKKAEGGEQDGGDGHGPDVGEGPGADGDAPGGQ